VIQSFRDQATDDLFNGVDSKVARRRLPADLRRVAARRLDVLDSAATLADLRVPPANRLERLRGDRDGQHSIRINSQYRVCFVWTDAGPEAVDYH